ncbi:LpqN/LpqT family lipoprotein [Tsukamurella sp. 1534]|uniref:LpqN/LpqT family lipoprotein n=1 Tax=Tsukamurella sp. 1534 TaxID=1151061 RepID=UPI0003067B11|nr:LpqN/LpqT family lipoprotein [Tsukamurella sp. 1534]
MMKFRALAAVPVALALPFAGCAQSTTGEPVAAATPTGSSSAPASSAPTNGACAAVAGRILDLPAKKAGEPRIGLPQPAGWDRQTSQDNDLIRAAIVNKALAADQFAPNAVVTLEDATGATPQQLLDAQIEGLKTTVRVEGMTAPVPGTLCGFRTTSVSYSMPAVKAGQHRATVVAVAVPSGSKLWGVTLTVQTTDPNNATYKRDSETILTGLRITP